jgi:predicted NAD/FAD-dependent oxidoreductase
VAVVGAGLAGLMAARTLQQSRDVRVTVFEKSRAPGGRAATRRDGARTFDHGAQYFTHRDARLADDMVAWREAGVIAPWNARVAARDNGTWRAANDAETRWVAVPGMRSLGEHLAQGVDVRYADTVSALRADAERWWLHTSDAQEHGPFDHVLLAMPAPQSHTLLAAHAPDFLSHVTATAMQPCIAALVELAAAPAVSWDAAFVNDDAVLAWVARNASKPSRGTAECWVLHARADWSVAQLEAEPASLVAPMLDAFNQLLDARVDVVHAVAHRWRYAIPAPVAADAPLAHYDAASALGAAGDWCAGGRVEGALLSGRELAEQLLASLVRR